jgi:hypothetical protein
MIPVLLLGCAANSWSNPFSNSYETPEEVVEAYLAALSNNDENKLSSLIAPNHEATVDLQNKIAKYGGIKLDNMQISYMPTENPYYLTARLQFEIGREDETRGMITDELYLQREGDEWFLVMGTTTANPIPNPVTAP